MTKTVATKNGNTLRITETARSEFTVELWAEVANRSVLGVARRAYSDREVRKLVAEMAKAN